MELSEAITTIDSFLVNPRRGLPEELFLLISRLTPLINVDLLIHDEAGRTLLTWRDDEFFGAGWHLPGGIIRYKELATDRVRACALVELGAEVDFDPLPILVSETIREPNDRGHFISLLYLCRLVSPLDESRRACSDPPAAGAWQWHIECPLNLLDVQSQYARIF